MSLPTLGITLNLYDGTGAPLTTGSAVFTTTGPVTVNSGLQEITPAPVTEPMAGGLPTAAIIPTDIAGSSPSGWGWEVAFPGVPGGLASFTFKCPAGPVSFTAATGTPGVVTWTPTAALTSLPPGTGVQFASGAPAGTANATTYYVTSSTSSTCQVSATLGGSPLAFTGSGSGQLAVVSYLLSGLAPLGSALSLSQFMLAPSGTPASGQVPVATGTGVASAWGTVSGGGGAVSSVFTRTGAVTAQSGDYAVGQVTGAAPLASPVLTGTPTAPTATTGDSTTKLATTAFTATAVAAETTRATAAEALTTAKLAPSGDTTGVTDLAAINAALTGFPRKKAVLAPGQFYISAPIAPQNNTWLQGSGVWTTNIAQGSSFAGTGMYLANLSSTISDLTLSAPSTTIASNVAASAVVISQPGGTGLISGVTVKDVGFANINGWAVNFTDLGTSGAPTGCLLQNLTGNASGGINVLGASRTVGLTTINCTVSATGTGTAANLDGLYIQDCYDLEVLGATPGFLNGTNNAIHLHGHVANVRFVGPGEIGGNAPAAGNGSCGILIEDGTSGHAVNVHFAHYTQQTADIGISLQGSCTDISFTDMEVNANNTHGVVVNTTGKQIQFAGCVIGQSANGQAGTALSGTYYDINWSGTGTGAVTDCKFYSQVVASGSNGVQKSVAIAAAQLVPFSLVRFLGSGASSANWFTNAPSGVLETSSGGFNFFAGIKPVTSAWGPADQGLAAWTFDGAPMASQGFQPTTAGTGYATAFMIRQATTISQFFCLVQTAGATLTSGQCFAAVYNSTGTLLGSTADQSTNWQSTGLNGAANAGVALTVAAGQSLTLLPGKYFAAVYYNGTTAPKFLAGTGNPVFLVANTGQTGANARCATLFTGAAGTVPTTCTYTAGGSAIWFGVS